MRLTKLCIALVFALNSFCFSYSANSTITEKASVLTENNDYTVVREYHDGMWWLVYYNSDGLKVMEVPDPWQ